MQIYHIVDRAQPREVVFNNSTMRAFVSRDIIRPLSLSYRESIENSRHDHVLHVTRSMRASAHMRASAYTLVRGQVVVIPSARMLNLTRRGKTACCRPVAPAVGGARQLRLGARKENERQQPREGVWLALRRKTLRMQLAGPRGPVVVVTTIDLSRGKVSSAKNGRQKTCTDTGISLVPHRIKFAN